MARELNYTIQTIFRSDSPRFGRAGVGIADPLTSDKVVYMSIPINKPVFEVPIMAFDTFRLNSKDNFEEKEIVVVLKTFDRIPRYATLSRYMRDVLLSNYREDRLIKLEAKEGNNPPKIYYATYGAIFDSDFTPIMMCSWQVEKYKTEEGQYGYNMLKPIMRIDPDVYMHKDDGVRKFIANRLPLLVLDTFIDLPHMTPSGTLIVTNVRADVRIEIDKCPFQLKQADTPSISTTNEELLQIAMDHIDEMIQ